MPGARPARWATRLRRSRGYSPYRGLLRRPVGGQAGLDAVSTMGHSASEKPGAGIRVDSHLWQFTLGGMHSKTTGEVDTAAGQC